MHIAVCTAIGALAGSTILLALGYTFYDVGAFSN